MTAHKAISFVVVSRVEDRGLIVLGDNIGVGRTTWGRMRKLAENTTQGKPGN